MDAIDRLGWVAGFSINPEGTVIGVRSNDQDLLERIRREVLLPEWTVHPLRYHFLFSFYQGGPRGRGRRDFTLLYDQTERVARSLDTEVVLRELEQRLHEKVMQFSFHKTAVRATALSIDGKAHLYLGDAVRLLKRAGDLQERGASLLSPQYSLIDAEGLVHPYHNRSILEPGLGLPRCTHPLPLGRIWAEKETTLSFSPAYCAWLLFSHILDVHDSALKLQALSALVTKLQVSGGSLVNQGQ